MGPFRSSPGEREGHAWSSHEDLHLRVGLRPHQSPPEASFTSSEDRIHRDLGLVVCRFGALAPSLLKYNPHNLVRLWRTDRSAEPVTPGLVQPASGVGCCDAERTELGVWVHR
jgi:hypothetical protein